MNKTEVGEKFRSAYMSVVLTILIVLFAWLVGKDFIVQSYLKVLGVPTASYYMAATNNLGAFYALGVDCDSNEIISQSEDRNKVETRKLTSYGFSPTFRPEDTFLSSDGDIIIGGKDSNKAQIYLIESGSDTARLLISKETLLPYDSVFSHIFEDNTGYSFIYFYEENAEAYVYDEECTSLSILKSYQKPAKIPIAVFPDGKEVFYDQLMQLSEDDRNVSGREARFLLDIWGNNDSLWYLDNRTADFWCNNSRNSKGLMRNLSSYSEDAVVSVTVSNAGAVFVTEAGKVSLISSPTNQKDLTYMLLPYRMLSIILLIGAAVLVVLMVPLFYTMMEYNRKRGQSLILREGLSAIGLIVTVVLFLYIAVINPHCEKVAEDWIYERLKVIAHENMEKPSSSVEDILINASESQNIFGVAIKRFKTHDGMLMIQLDDEIYGNVSSFRRSNVFVDAIENAMTKGEAATAFIKNGRVRFVYALKAESFVVSVSCSDESLDIIKSIHNYHSLTVMVLTLVIPCLAILLSLWLISRRISRITRACEDFVDGKLTSIRPDGADELGALALGLESALIDKNNAIRKCERVEKTYETFLPAKLVKTFGISNIEEIKPGMYVKKEMVAMRVSLSLSEDDEANYQYEDRFQGLYQTIQRMCGYAKSMDGFILSFDSKGFTALFEPGTGNEIKAAVAMKQDMNTTTSSFFSNDKMKICFFIGLEKLPIVIGCVGNQNRKQIVGLYSTFSDRINMNRINEFRNVIICRGNVLKNCSVKNRRLGTIYIEGKPESYYEIYEGDHNELMLAKTNSLEVFAKATDALDKKDYATAKKYYFEILRQNIHDEMARYLLNLADELEKGKLL